MTPMTALLSISVAIFTGLMMTRVIGRWHLPDVTAYLIAGVLIGPSLIGRLNIPGLGFAGYDLLDELSLITWASSPSRSATSSGSPSCARRASRRL